MSNNELFFLFFLIITLILPFKLLNKNNNFFSSFDFL